MTARSHTTPCRPRPAHTAPFDRCHGPRASRADSAFASFRSTGDPLALEAVVREAAQPLLNAARSMTRDEGTAEDLVQTTFVAAIDGASRYDPEHPVVPWLLGILSNRARRNRRAERRRPDPGRLPRETPSPDPREALVARELERRIDRAVQELPPRYRKVVDLHVRHELSPREIARALGRPHSTVRSQLARGLARLRRILPRCARDTL